MKHRSRFLLLLSLCFGVQLGVVAQTSRGTVTGLVTDPQTAVVANATVELTGNATNVVRRTQTNDAGIFRFDAVDPGDYRLEIKLSGFKTFTSNQLTVGAAQVITQDAQMEIGNVSETITVVETAVVLRADSPVRGANIDSVPVTQLPYQSRNPVDLGLTVPGVVTNKFTTPAGTYVVNGTRGRSNNFMIDGTDNNDISVAGEAFKIRNPGSVGEVSIQTTNYDSEFGRAGGAVVNVVTKSGTNAFHGTAGVVIDTTWDDAISSSLAQDPVITARGHNLPGTEQQFDGTVGGPIIRNKTFFHLSYLELRQFSTSSTDMNTLTAAGRATLRSVFPKGTSPNADLLLQISDGFDGNDRRSFQALGNGRPDIEFGHLITPYAQSTPPIRQQDRSSAERSR